MKKYLFTLFTPLFVFAQSYMAKVEPYEQFTIYSQTSGEIVQLDKTKETKTIKNELIKLDDELEQNQLIIYKKQLDLYIKKLDVLQKNYNKYVNIKGKSQADKDEKLIVIYDLKVSIEALKLNIKNLEDTIKKKTINIQNLYIKSFNVNKGDFIQSGANLATAYDVSKSKLIVYVSSDDFKNIENKKVFIDGKLSKAKIEKLDKTVDEVYVSAYKVTLIVESKEYGKSLKVEFRK